MKHLFLPYNLALLAKEKGFDEPCIRFYELNNKKLQQGISSEYWGDYTDFYNWNEGKKPYKPFCECISAPLYQQIIDWFREKHGIILDIDFAIGWGYGFIPHGCEIQLPTNFMDGFETYYEALNKAIEEAFKLI